MSSIKAFTKKNAVKIYFLLTFLFSWGCMSLMIKPYSFPLTPDASELVGPLLYVGMLIGPSASGLILVGFVDGKAGYRELFSRLTKWRVGVTWYVAALLGTPILASMILLALSVFSPEFTPTLFTSGDKTGLIIMGIGIGLMVGFFEEIGWTGFATPKMRQRHGLQNTGLSVGLLWGLWHFPPFWELNSFSGIVPIALLLARLFSWLPPFRILMVWIHEKTESLLIIILVHSSLVFTTMALPPATLSGSNLLVWLIIWGVTLNGAAWVITGRK